jgi:hypothetical protein
LCKTFATHTSFLAHMYGPVGYVCTCWNPFGYSEALVCVCKVFACKRICIFQDLKFWSTLFLYPMKVLHATSFYVQDGESKYKRKLCTVQLIQLYLLLVTCTTRVYPLKKAVLFLVRLFSKILFTFQTKLGYVQNLRCAKA